MPSFEGQVSEEQILQLIAYIKTLEGDAARRRAAATKRMSSERP